jgi:hypothetical protein
MLFSEEKSIVANTHSPSRAVVVPFERRSPAEPARDRITRAAACAIARHAWDLALLEEPSVSEAVRVAERAARGELGADALPAAHLAATLPPDRSGWHPERFLQGANLCQASRFAVREACRATCLASADEALEKAITSTALALTARELDGTAAPLVVGALLSFSINRRGPKWRAAFFPAHAQYRAVVDTRAARCAAALRSHADGRMAARNTMTARGTIVALTQGHSLLLYGWGLSLTNIPEPVLRLDDADGLLALVVRHPDPWVLWQKLTRDDWRGWMLDTAQAFNIVPPDTKIGSDAFNVLNVSALTARAQEVWYGVDSDATQLTASALVCVFR